MPASPTSSEVGFAPVVGPLGSASIVGTVGDTPLLTLTRSGEGCVYVKHEGYQPSGSFFDRLAERQISERCQDPVVVLGANAHSLAVAARCAAVGASATVVGWGSGLRRLRPLLAVYGVRLVRVASAEEGRSAVDERVESGATEVLRDDIPALRHAFSEVATEVRAVLGSAPTTWVVPAFGGHAALSVLEGTVEALADDVEAERRLDGPAACRRVQTGHREGMLLSPLGAEVVEAAVNAAGESPGAVVALIPEGGHRYLGWW